MFDIYELKWSQTTGIECTIVLNGVLGRKHMQCVAFNGKLTLSVCASSFQSESISSGSHLIWIWMSWILGSFKKSWRKFIISRVIKLHTSYKICPHGRIFTRYCLFGLSRTHLYEQHDVTNANANLTASSLDGWRSYSSCQCIVRTLVFLWSKHEGSTVRGGGTPGGALVQEKNLSPVFFVFTQRSVSFTTFSDFLCPILSWLQSWRDNAQVVPKSISHEIDQLVETDKFLQIFLPECRDTGHFRWCACCYLSPFDPNWMTLWKNRCRRMKHLSTPKLNTSTSWIPQSSVLVVVSGSQYCSLHSTQVK